MIRDHKFAVHAEEEKGVYNFFRGIREIVFRPLVVQVAATRISPETLSYLGVLTVVPFIFFFSFNPWISFFFLLAHFFLDSLDGSLSRYTKSESERGAFIDMVCDYLTFFIIFVTFMHFGLVDYLTGVIYVIVSMALQGFITLAIMKKIKLFQVIRSKLFVYLFFLIFLFTGQNFINELLVVMIFYTVIVDYFVYRKITCSI